MGGAGRHPRVSHRHVGFNPDRRVAEERVAEERVRVGEERISEERVSEERVRVGEERLGMLKAMVDRMRHLPGGRQHALVAWLPAIAWAGLIFAFSAQPNLRFAPDELLDFLVRKAGHMAVFGMLALLAWRAVAVTTPWRRPGAWALALAVLYAISDELHQGFVAGRHSSPVDVGIDATGALLAVVAAWLIRSRRS